MDFHKKDQQRVASYFMRIDRPCDCGDPNYTCFWVKQKRLCLCVKCFREYLHKESGKKVT